MTNVRIMAVLQGRSNLPEDRMVNTFHFSDPGQVSYAIYAALCFAWVEKFYNNDSVSQYSLGECISRYIDRDATMLAYNLDLPPGEREPTAQPFTMGQAVYDAGLPEEVAICLTLQGAPPVTPRRRGRLYLGPFINGDITNAFLADSEPSRPNSGGNDTITEIIAYAGGILMEDSSNTWCIRSTTPTENFVPIVSGYVDNAWDTQRRRGPDPTARRMTENITG